MSELCPYCHQSELTSRCRETLWMDLTARALSIARIYLELSKRSDFSVRQFGKAMLDADSLPIATSDDRICPYCYRGHVTMKNRDSVWFDVATKIVGLVRVYMEAKRGDNVPWLQMARAIVEGSNPDVYMRKPRAKKDDSPTIDAYTDFDEDVKAKRKTVTIVSSSSNDDDLDDDDLDDDDKDLDENYHGILDVSSENEEDDLDDVDEKEADEADDSSDDDEDYTDKRLEL